MGGNSSSQHQNALANIMNNLPVRSASEGCLVSIITVSKDDHEGLKITTKSIYEQTFNNYELIIIEGGSDEKNADFLRQQSQSGVTVIIEADEGIYDAMNKGIGHAQGQWIVFMNAGDMFAGPEVLGHVASLISDDADVIFSDWIYRETAERVTANLDKLNVRHQAVVYRKSLHNTYGNYVVGKQVTISDYMFFLSIAHKHWVFCTHPIAICDKTGASSNPRHFYQRIACELIFRKRSVLNSCGVFLLYPFYRFIKRSVLRIR